MAQDLYVKPQKTRPDGNSYTQWEPSDNQLKMLKLCQDEEYRIPISKATEKIGITRRCFYLWQQNPDFIEWWVESSKKWAALSLPEIHQVGLEAAKGRRFVPGHADRKLMFELLDPKYMPKLKTEAVHKIEWGAEVNRSEWADDGESPGRLPAGADVIDAEIL